MFLSNVLSSPRGPKWPSTAAGTPTDFFGHSPKKSLSPPNPSEQGFAAIFFIAALPVLIILLALSFRQFQIILVERKTRALCRIELLHAQTLAAESIRHLLEMNKAVVAAKTLREWAILAMIAAAASENAPAFVLAEQQYTAANETLEGLAVAQKALILKADFDMNSGLYQAQQAVRKVWLRQPRGPLALQSPKGTIWPFLPVKVAVRAVDDSDETPEYELEESFSDKQALQVSWKTEWKHQEKQEWTKQNWSFQSGCAATLVPESGNHFRPRLSGDKFSSKSFLFW